MSEPAKESIDKTAERLLDGFILALSEFDTETLEAIVDHRDIVQPGGWFQAIIREYLSVWR